jgi:hypothetical protein
MYEWTIVSFNVIGLNLSWEAGKRFLRGSILCRSEHQKTCPPNFSKTNIYLDAVNLNKVFLIRFTKTLKGYYFNLHICGGNTCVPGSRPCKAYSISLTKEQSFFNVLLLFYDIWIYCDVDVRKAFSVFLWKCPLPLLFETGQVQDVDMNQYRKTFLRALNFTTT